MITESYCQTILAEYPEYVTKEQMYRICHISKKTCLFLLESGLVPCVDSGKKTRRFKIKTTDVVQYLRERGDSPELYKAPDDYYKTAGDKKALLLEKTIAESDLPAIRQYYEERLAVYPDVLSIDQVAKFTGYCKNSVRMWCSKQKLKCFFIRQQYKIPKDCLLDFLVSYHFFGIAVKSSAHRKFIAQIRGLINSKIT